MKCRNSKKNTNYGFTLVELIVVLVILAILAAILIPALLGWIDRARRKQDVLDAKNCLTAAQAELTSYYVNKDKKVDGQKTIIPTTDLALDGKTAPNGIRNNDVYIYYNHFNSRSFEVNGVKGKYYSNQGLPGYDTFSKRILKTAGYNSEAEQPYYLIIGTGNYLEYKDTDPHKPYTVYFLFYQKTKDSKPIFFDGNSWVETYPKESITDPNDQKYNYFVVNGERIRIQYYILSNKETKDWWYNTLPANAKK